MSQTVNDLRSTKGKVVKEGSLKPKSIDKLEPQQRAWSDKVIRALGLQSAGSQGRMVAGAVASAQIIENSGTNEEKAKARGLRDTVLAAGNPPWKDTKKALAAGSAKAHLDILSIPGDQRALEPLDTTAQGINAAFWIKRRDASDNEEKSFLCKTAGVAQFPEDIAPSGGAKGSEVAREALSSRAAQLLFGQTGIDIGMPETHIVELDPALVPGRENETAQLTCSVQEYRASTGGLKTATSQQKRGVKPDQIAALAIFDTITLNTDRHGGNILLDPGGNLIPIDHGESFAESNADGIGRVKATLGGPHNALLRLPAAHEPMSQAMLKKLKGLDADKYGSSLAKDQQQIGTANPSMAGTISDGAIENSRRSAAFVKLAVSNKPPLSPAAIQTALGSAAEELFAPQLSNKAFLALAKRVIARIAPGQAVLKEVQTSSDIEYGQLVKKLDALGWELAPRGGAPSPYHITDPLVAISILRNNIQRPNNQAQATATLKSLHEGQGQSASPTDSLTAVAAFRADTIQQLIRLAAPGNAANLGAQLDLAKKRPMKERLEALSLVLAESERQALSVQTARLANFNTVNRPADLKNSGLAIKVASFTLLVTATDDLSNGALIDFDATMTRVETAAGQGDFIPAAVSYVDKNLRALADGLMINNDPDLADGLRAVTAGDPFAANDKYIAFKARAAAGNMADPALAQLQAEFNDLTAGYLTDPTVMVPAVEFQRAFAARNIPGAMDALATLKGSLAEGNALPSEDKFNDTVASWGIPDDDAGLDAAVTAINGGNLNGFRTAFVSLKARLKAGEFGTGALDEIRADLTSLRQTYTIANTQTDLVDMEYWLNYGDAIRARVGLSRLEALAAAGAF